MVQQEKGFTLNNVIVMSNNKHHRVYTYKMVEGHPAQLPGGDYYAMIKQGYLTHNLNARQLHNAINKIVNSINEL